VSGEPLCFCGVSFLSFLHPLQKQASEPAEQNALLLAASVERYEQEGTLVPERVINARLVQLFMGHCEEKEERNP
jgi:hypothetical protein